jgi:hypothetical protein
LNEPSPDDFEVDLTERRVIHKPSGMWFSFYEYLTEEDWKKSDSVIYRDNPEWTIDRMKLAAMAKEIAIEKGMTAKKPS